MTTEKNDDDEEPQFLIVTQRYTYEEPLFPVSIPFGYSLAFYAGLGVAGFIADYSYWTTGENPGLAMKIVLPGACLMVLYLVGVLTNLIDPD